MCKKAIGNNSVFLLVILFSLNQRMEQITEFPEWTPLLLVVFIVIVMIIIYRYILNKLE